MSAIMYSKMGGKNDPVFGKFEHPIRALIENESAVCERNSAMLDLLFNVEKSNRYAETVIGETDFSTFQSVQEGQGAENDSVEVAFKKTIEHIAFMKEFYITKEMADDAKYGMGADLKNKPRKFVRAYYKTRNKIATEALKNGTASSMVFNRATVDLTTGDGLSLFNNAHTYASDRMTGLTQSNYFYGDFTSTAAKFEEALGKLANKMRNFKDESGENLGYVADVLILPCNRPVLETMAKKVIGSERTVGSGNNDINTQYGKWTLVVLDGWETDDDRFMVMSSEANRNLLGSMFYNRVPLDVTSDVDTHTRNYFWNGYCRFGIGFNTWKHILLAVDSDSAVSGATSVA